MESHLRSLSLLEESRAEFSGGLWTTHEAVLHFAFLHRHRSEYDRDLVTDDDQRHLCTCTMHFQKARIKYLHGDLYREVLGNV